MLGEDPGVSAEGTLSDSSPDTAIDAYRETWTARFPVENLKLSVEKLIEQLARMPNSSMKPQGS